MKQKIFSVFMIFAVLISLAGCSIGQPEATVPQPASGQIFIGTAQAGPANLTVESTSGNAYYVKLKNQHNEDIFSFFVPAGETVEIAVPQEPCYVYFASGRTWQGPELLFGEHTSYSKDPELTDFGEYTVSYSFVPSADGNFSEVPVSADAF